MKHIPVILFGAGGVGRALLWQIVVSRPVVAGRNQIVFNVVAVVDSRSWVWAPAGLADDQLLALVAAKAEGQRLGPERPGNVEIVEQAAAAGLEGALVVDVTAEAGMEPLLDRALASGYGVVLANKKPLAGPWSTAQRYYNNPRLRHESTVGGGQPVIATLRYLLDTNDPIFRIEGQMSGTLGYICGRLDEGVPFSQAVAEARANGYTEPDPREDLGGLDVRRKIMILGRMAGWPLEEADITIETLYPPALASLPVEAFMAKIGVMDGPIRERVAAARAAGALLRYTAELEAGVGSVGLKPVSREEPLANLKYISFRTALYNDQPMMIGGKGAGVEMTAAGVLGDMIGLVREG
ncbi:MAG: homoserine dehydrogenase [Chloroflexi bacterium]|nr:homoserine dehydrogenase [Chloroflexota bacterium]MCI0725836.1 homoserine dehydrogenase [Chloroflexota bacterium]